MDFEGFAGGFLRKLSRKFNEKEIVSNLKPKLNDSSLIKAESD